MTLYSTIQHKKTTNNAKAKGYFNTRKLRLFMSNTAQVLRPKKACLMLAVSRSTLYRLVKAGELKTVKLSERAVGILESDLVAYLGRSL